MIDCPDNRRRRALSHQMFNILQFLLDLLMLQLKLAFICIESLYKLVTPDRLKSVKGEVVLITGSGHGMGRELALLYASRGATVVGWDINSQNNEETVKEITDRGYPKAFAYYCDVSNRQNVFELAAKVRQEVGNVTVLVNNAGIMPTHTLLEHSEAEIERLVGINVMAHFWTLQAFLPSMKETNHGHVVAMSSCAGLFGLENLVPYCGTKFAVRGIMEALHEELRLANYNGVKFTTVFPYMVDTGLCKNPKIKYPGAMSLLKPRDVAKIIINAQQANKLYVSIPRYFIFLNNFLRLLPVKVSLVIKDFLDAGLDSDLDAKKYK